MEFLKKQNLFSFLYDGKSIWNCEVQKMVSENENEIITELALSDGLKVTNIAKKHSGNAYEWVNWFEIPVQSRRKSYRTFGIVTMLFRLKKMKRKAILLMRRIRTR